MGKSIYFLFRSLFGLYIIWMGLINLDKLESNENYVKQTVDNFDKTFDLGSILTFFDLHNHIPVTEVQKYTFNTDNIKNAASEIVYVMNFSLIIGGVLCFLGYSISFTFILIGLVLDIMFIHNYFYFRDEKMKVNVLKMLAILGGAFHLA